MRLLDHVFLSVGYYLSWVVFGLVGVLLNVVCIPFLVLPRRERFGTRTRAAIRKLFVFWLKWHHMTRVVNVRWRFEASELTTGTVYVANHPTILDATFLLARLPDAICIFKPKLINNPSIGPAALLAGYAAGDTGVDLIRDVAEKIAAGRSLLIFPEGTRTTAGQKLNPIKPGFALIARRAGAPIRMIIVRSSRNLTPRGRAWWRLPDFPSWVEFTLGDEIPADSPLSVSEISAEVERRFLNVVERVSSS